MLAVQLGYVPSTQFFGHLCVLQFLSSWREGHSIPPYDADVITERVRFVVPITESVLQDASQAAQEPYSDITQSTEHGASLHTRVSSMYGHT
jgi:hypothetical protein